MISSDKTRELVVREYRPAHAWSAQEVQEALDECLAEEDLIGASALFGRCNQEHKAFFGYDFRDRTVDSALPESSVQEAIVLNCAHAAQYCELLSGQQLR